MKKTVLGLIAIGFAVSMMAQQTGTEVAKDGGLLTEYDPNSPDVPPLEDIDIVDNDAVILGEPVAPGEGELWPMRHYTKGKKTYNVPDMDDNAMIYAEAKNKANCIFVVSKQEFRLYVYEVIGKDTVLLAHFPVCYAKYPEGKTKTGDMRTPDCDMQHPFKISQIQNASSWAHDFKDGRGSILSYGAWFMRLNLAGSNNTPAVCNNRSIGIHGSTNNAESVPGRDSEGCIRLRDADIKTLHDKYAQVGVKVVVKPYRQSKYAFETAAEKKLGKRYVSQTKGNRLFKK